MVNIKSRPLYSGFLYFGFLLSTAGLFMVLNYYFVHVILSDSNYYSWHWNYIIGGLLEAIILNSLNLIFIALIHKRFKIKRVKLLVPPFLVFIVLSLSSYRIFKSYVMTGALGATWSEMEIFAGAFLGDSSYLFIFLGTFVFYIMNWCSLKIKE